MMPVLQRGQHSILMPSLKSPQPDTATQRGSLPGQILSEPVVMNPIATTAVEGRHRGSLVAANHFSSSWESEGSEKMEDDEDECCTSGFVSETEQDARGNGAATPETMLLSTKVSFDNYPVSIVSDVERSVSDVERSVSDNDMPYGAQLREENGVNGAVRRGFFSPPAQRRQAPLAKDGRPAAYKTTTAARGNKKMRHSSAASTASTASTTSTEEDSMLADAHVRHHSSGSVDSAGSRSRDAFSRRHGVGSRFRPKLASRRQTLGNFPLKGSEDTDPCRSIISEGSSSPEYARSPSLDVGLARSHRSRRSSVDLLREGSFCSRIQVFEVSFLLPTKKSVILDCPGNRTVGQIKDMLWDSMMEDGIIEAQPDLADQEQYSLKYKKFGMDYELYDQEQLFQTLSIVGYWQTKRKALAQLRVELKKPGSEEARQFQVIINGLIGVDMDELILSSNNDEADISRRKLVSARHAAVSARDSELYAMEPALTHSEVPEPIKKVCAMWIEINIQFEDQKDKTQVILFQVSETPLDLLQFLFNPDSGKRTLLGIPDSADACMYTLKVCGRESYLYRGHVFLKYSYIRRCLLKKVPIHLAVVKKPDVEEDSVPNHGEPDFIDDCCNLTGSHQQLSSLTKIHSQVFTMSLWDIHTPYSMKLVGVDGLMEPVSNSSLNLYVEAGIYHGGELLCPAKGISLPSTADGRLVINQHFHFDVAVCNLPKAARMHMVVYAVKKISRRSSTLSAQFSPSANSLSPPATSFLTTGSPGSKRRWFGGRFPNLPSPRTSRRASDDPSSPNELLPGVASSDGETDSQDSSLEGCDRPEGLEPLYWVNAQLLDHRAVLRTGYQQLAMWHVPLKSDGDRDTSKFSPNSCTSEHPDRGQTASIYLILDEYAHRVACPTAGLGSMQKTPSEGELKGDEVRSPSKKFLRESLEAAISSSDPLKPLTKSDKDLLWSCRDICKKRPEALPRFLQSLNWADKSHVLEMHKLLTGWAPLTIEVALQLMDYHFADEAVRCLAVTRLEQLENDELLTFLLQLVQTLKFEPYHDSALAYFLLERALQSKRIGHNFYWFLRAEMDAPEYRERFGLLLEAYLRGCGRDMLNTIYRQQRVNEFLMKVSTQVKEEKLEMRAFTLQRLIRASDVMKDDMRPVYDSSMIIGDLIVENCKCMDSKKVPLWLEFANKDPTTVSPAPVKVIFKQGDDLRQDMLTLQMIKLMDKLWQDNGLDLHMVPYGCMSAGCEVGMIEVVLEAETVASIQRKRGGDILSNAMASFADETLAVWLKEKQSSRSEHVQAIRRFVASCAGYCVATYVLGIGDRHNDNIMITKSGNLFHIDFGHFLGNTKKFLGGLVNRERAPFVLTPDFVHIMGKKDSANFRNFLDDACRAYNIIRKNAHLFINLFSMMKCTGIPELTCTEDIAYLRNVLLLDKTDEEAAQHFTKQVDRCLELAWTVRCNFVAHTIKRR